MTREQWLAYITAREVFADLPGVRIASRVDEPTARHRIVVLEFRFASRTLRERMGTPAVAFTVRIDLWQSTVADGGRRLVWEARGRARRVRRDMEQRLLLELAGKGGGR